MITEAFVLDRKQIKKLDKAYHRQIKNGGVRLRGNAEDMEGTLTEKLQTPSGAHVLCFSDCSKTVCVIVSEPIYARCSVGQMREITYCDHFLLGMGPCADNPSDDADDTPFQQNI